MNNRGFFIKDLLLKLLFVVVMIFVLIWLFPTKEYFSPLFEGIFKDNITTMKEAANSYFTNERMPKKVGDKIKMTLQEMYDKKLVLQINDKNGNACDAKKSYVEVTKLATEYELKVMLSCGDEEEYIIEYLGCIDRCQGFDCEEEKVEESKIVEYQFKKDTIDKVAVYKCPTGYKLDGTICYKNTTKTTTIAATPVYSQKEEKVEDAKYKNVVSTSCPSGWTSTLFGCEKNATAKVTTTTKYECASGWNLVDTDQCVKAATSNTTTSTTYSCPSGWTRDGSKCYKNATKSTSTTTETSTVYDSSKTLLRTYTEKTCDTCSTVRYYVYRITKTTYSCSSGTKSGTKCVKNATANTSSNTTYSCATGTLSGKECFTNATKKTDSKTTYSCATGTLKDTKCSIDKIITQTKKYYCENSAWTLKGTSCYYEEPAKLTGYKCSTGKLNGTKCNVSTTKKVTTKATKTYQEKTYTEYKWSTSKTLEGWTSTGKTRIQTKKS